MFNNSSHLAVFTLRESQLYFEEIKRMYLLINTLLIDDTRHEDNRFSQTNDENVDGDTLSQLNDENFEGDTLSQIDDESLTEDDLTVSYKPQLTTEVLNQATFKIIQVLEATIILRRFFIKCVYKNRFLNDSYNTYLSLLEPDEQNNSEAVFGRHQAEISTSYTDHIANPYINHAGYLRICPVNLKLLEKLVPRFTKIDLNQFICYPFIELQATSIDEVLVEFKVKLDSKKSNKTIRLCFDFFRKELSIYSKPNLMTVGIITRPRINANLLQKCKQFLSNHNETANISPEDFKKLSNYYYEYLSDFLNSCGLKASPWEISKNIEHTQDLLPLKNLKLLLPNNKTRLFNSNIYTNLEKISQSNNNVKLLAKALVQLLNNDINLTENSIKRIALFLDIANTFYSNNYSRYAFYVYCIVHELSLSLLQETIENKEIIFEEFQTQCREFILSALDITDNQVSYMTLGAASGSHAHFLAQQFAQTILQKDCPDFMVFNPNYYEFDKLYKHQVKNNPDIFEISTGPICNKQGVEAGIDINDFIEVYINEEKLSILLIDITTTMYKKLKLNDNANRLVSEGKLIILMLESGQKTHLLHTDQAQYGQVHIVCHNQFIEKSNDLIEKSKIDFFSHIDLLIGAFIRSKCQDTLEAIKEKHFFNGYIMRQVIGIDSNEDIIESNVPINLQETFFIICKNIQLQTSILRIVPKRESFGHYETTYSEVLDNIRLCAGPNDLYDILMQSLAIRLQTYPLPNLFEIFSAFKNINTPVSKSEQIIILAISNLMIINMESICELESDNISLKIYESLKTVLSVCQNDFLGRKQYSNIQDFYKNLITSYRQRIDANLHSFQQMHTDKDYRDIIIIRNKYLEFCNYFPQELTKHLNKFEDFILNAISFRIGEETVRAKYIDINAIIDLFNNLYSTGYNNCKLFLIRLIIDIKDNQEERAEKAGEFFDTSLTDDSKQTITTVRPKSDYPSGFFNRNHSKDTQQDTQIVTQRRHSI